MVRKSDGRLAVAAAMVLAVLRLAAAVEWEFPRLGGCHEGMAFAGGASGVLVWGGGDTVNLTVGRVDMWDHRGGYPWTDGQSYTNILAAVRDGDEQRLKGLFNKDTPEGEPSNPYMLPLGRVVLKIPGAELMLGELDPFTGLGWIDFAIGGKTSRVEIAMSKSEGGVFAMKFQDGIVFEAKTLPATDFAVYEKELKPLGFEKAKVLDCATSGCGGFTWRLPADMAAWIAWQKKGGEFALRTGRGERKSGVDAASFDAVAKASREHWAKFWAEGARVKVPDPVVQRVFDYGMYRFGAMTDPDGVPAGLQGPWLEDDGLVPWHGDYHFNVNVQECYSPAYRGGHFANLMPLFRMVLSWRGRLRDNAKKFVGIDDGYVLPHSVDDRGVCIGGFWVGTTDHGCAAWVAAMMMKYVRYSGDTSLLKSGAYDFMKGAMNVYRAMMEERGGRLSIPLGSSPEWGGRDMKKAVGRDPSFQLAAAHRLARDLIDAAALLGETPDSMWLDVEKRLPQCTADESGIKLFEEQRFSESHRHHSHMAGIYPFDTIDFADVASRKVADATYATWVANGTRLWSGWCVPWASILHTRFGNAHEAVGMLHAWDKYYCDDGHGSHHDAVRPGFTDFLEHSWIMQMDGQCGAATAVMELMVHEVNGKPEFFRGCPPEWKDVSFENIRLSNGRRVSGRCLNGKITIW